MKTLTVFTPAYNRANTIEKTYQSLCRQTCKDFEWLVVNDGSTDNTKDLIAGWTKEGKINIRYIYQENQGMHGAHNTAYKNIHTELNICIDSDDYMPDDAVEQIITFWKQNGSRQYAGIIGLDITKDGHIIGKDFPEGLKCTTVRNYYEKLGGRGDKKMVYRTDVINSYPEYPMFEGEHYIGLSYKYHLIDEDYQLLVINTPLVVVEYQDDGSSRGMWKQYWNNPKGFSFLRKFDMVQTTSWKRKLKDNIHYVSHSLRSRNKQFIRESPMKFLTILSIIPGISLYLVNKNKVKKGKLYR
ncbi:glycosyltransferase family 2 protein [Prevotella sp. kh1p2]|uniref:glycosyltransferase family 2 protein n=1 Tax=Prevotella sp. kh1p2 TaxID=1761883 RepID=UPI0008C33738|nr:glycosyltransferase family 2 protein [Prevotella sp. kh1p2]SET11007.1 Glycosyltransferase involved in cell wall bisynthesis [Prevotella sp. kh1p2]SNU11833.1 Glycosyltransferase involved in cell wall bisynthesis [Prevotellaceae bacterium KH2P17]